MLEWLLVTSGMRRRWHFSWVLNSISDCESKGVLQTEETVKVNAEQGRYSHGQAPVSGLVQMKYF